MREYAEENEGGITVLDPKKWSHRMTEKIPTNNGLTVKNWNPYNEKERD